MGNQKVVLVTGCAQGGIGYEYCRAFAEQNCQVFASDVASALDRTLALRLEGIDVVELDVTSDQSVASAVATVIEKHGRIDIVVNNAGIGCIGPLAELDLAAVRQAWEVNALGQLRVTRAVVPHMVAQHSGCIVNIGSVVGQVPTPWAGAYCSSKAAAHAMAHTLRVELQPFGVHVVLVLPGAIQSNFGRANMDGLNSQNWRLYKEFNDSIEARAGASQGDGATDPKVFARHVVGRVLAPTPPKQIVYGHMAGLLSALEWAPLWVRDMFFSKRFNIIKK